MDDHGLSGFAREWKLVLLVIVGALLFAGLFAFYQKQQSVPIRRETARIVRFGLASNDTGNYPIVVVQRANGAFQQLKARRSVVIMCKRGAILRLTQRGTFTRIDQPPCPAQPTAR